MKLCQDYFVSNLCMHALRPDSWCRGAIDASTAMLCIKVRFWQLALEMRSINGSPGTSAAGLILPPVTDGMQSGMIFIGARPGPGSMGSSSSAVPLSSVRPLCQISALSIPAIISGKARAENRIDGWRGTFKQIRPRNLVCIVLSYMSDLGVHFRFCCP